MERNTFYTKEEIALELGISTKTLIHRIQEHDDALLKSLYKERRLFSRSEREYIVDKMHHQIFRPSDTAGGGIKIIPFNSSYFQIKHFGTLIFKY